MKKTDEVQIDTSFHRQWCWVTDAIIADSPWWFEIKDLPWNSWKGHQDSTKEMSNLRNQIHAAKNDRDKTKH